MSRRPADVGDGDAVKEAAISAREAVKPVAAWRGDRDLLGVAGKGEASGVVVEEPVLTLRRRHEAWLLPCDG
jgi:hypothetical protein